MKIKLLILAMFSGCLIGSAYAQGDESETSAVGTKIGGTLKGLNRVSLGIKGGANFLKAAGKEDPIRWNAGGVFEVTMNPLWGIGLEYLYLDANHTKLWKPSRSNPGNEIEGYMHDITLFGSLNVSNFISKYRSAGWQKLNLYLNVGAGASIYGESDDQYKFEDGRFMDQIVLVGGGLLEYDISKHFALGLEGQARVHPTKDYVGGNAGRMIVDANLLLRYKFGGAKNVRNIELVNYEPKVTVNQGVDQQALANLAKRLEKRLDDQDAVIKDLQNKLKDTKDTLDAVKDRLNKIDKYLQDRSNVGGGNASNVNFSRIEFALGKDVVRSAYYPSLDGIVSLLKQYPDWAISLKGYTDNTGSAAGNLKLSKERANSVKNYLIGKGISAGSIQAEGYGQADPIADNNTAKGRTQNRRVEVQLLTK